MDGYRKCVAQAPSTGATVTKQCKKRRKKRKHVHMAPKDELERTPSSYANHVMTVDR